jgi:predicted Na+-dependent transporter
MAWAIISGLLASTLLTLLVIPVLYRLLMKAGRRAGAAAQQAHELPNGGPNEVS